MKCVQTIILSPGKPQQSAILSLRPSINIQTAFALPIIVKCVQKLWYLKNRFMPLPGNGCVTTVNTLTPIIVKYVQGLWDLKKRIHAQHNNE